MSETAAQRPWAHTIVTALYFAVAIFFFVYLFGYYWTSVGGPTLLAITLVPVAFVLFTLNALRENDLYPRLPALANYAIAAIYIALSITVSIYMHTEHMAIGSVRAGFWNATDLGLGALMAILVLEYARKRYFVLCVINVVLILYAVYGKVVPGMFYHPGLSWTRIASAMSVEMSTGIFSNLPQLALTLIGSFILVLSALRAYGAVESILRGATRIAVRSPHALPQTALLGSLGVAAVSGSGAANAITTGSATIPAMIGAGMPRATAAAIESASSLGGQMMPPIMGISAFLMAEFLGVSYFDVIARGYAPAIIYFVGISVSVYLLSTRYRARLDSVAAEIMRWFDWVNIASFAAVVAGLIALMAILHLPPMFAALYVFLAVGGLLFVANLASVLFSDAWSWRAVVRPLGRFIDSFAGMTADLTLLLATLSIMTGALVITGVPTKVGSLLIQAAGVNLLSMVLVAFLFGALLGTGLPPAPTYIITALVIVPPMIRAGVEPWVVHFFAFFIAVWGELTPPTSVVAAVTAKIAEASFMQTLFRAILICSVLFILMAGVFIRPELVLEPGAAQLAAMGLIATATIGITFAIQAKFAERPALDVPVRLALAAIAFVVLLHPDTQTAALACVPVALFVGYWLIRRRNVPIAPARQAAE